MACRLPGARNIDEFWQVLTGNSTTVGEVPPDRFDISSFYSPEPSTPGKTLSRFGGFLDDVRGFDAGFFRISPREAKVMDPQQRLLLQVVWEALEDAGIPPSSLAGSDAGVFVGQATGDYATVTGTQSGSDVLGVTGSALRAVTAGRVSHAFDLRGPSLVLDTACSSSLVAVHLGRQSLLTGETDIAIVAGANLVLSPADAISYSQGDMLSPDGRCKFGDPSADGFVRGEGIVAMILKRTGDAKADGDRIRASIRGSAVNNDGLGNGLLLKPAASGQRAVIRSACRSAGVHPSELDYVEAHGSGTQAGDAVELEALSDVLDGRRTPDAPLFVGSVKSNVGHTEASAGITGLTKAVLIAEHGFLPATLHVTEPEAVRTKTPLLALATGNRELEPLGEHALLGVSSFGISGTNAHVIVSDQDSRPPDRQDENLHPGGPHVLVLSARSETSLRGLAAAYAGYLSPGGAGEGYALGRICHAAATARDALPYRLWVTGSTHEEMAAELRSLAEGLPAAGGAWQRAGETARTAFVFPGQGGQWNGMGRRLLEISPVFRDSMLRCDAVVRDELGWSVLDRLHDDGQEGVTAVQDVQPVLWAFEVSLAELWRSCGVEPDLCLGHSMGEAAAAYVAGALSLRDSAAVICRRSRLMAKVSGTGAMLATELTVEEATEFIGEESAVCLAAENSPRSTVLSGETAAIGRVAARIKAAGIHCREIKVDVASHSPLMDGLLADLRGLLADLDPGTRPASVTMLSTVHGREIGDGELTGAYWAANLRSPVRLSSSVTALVAETPCVLVELSPHPVLLGALQDCLEGSPNSAAITAQSRHIPEDVALVKALGKFFAAGGTIDWNGYYGGARPHLPLPVYQWDNEDFWTATSLPVPLGARAETGHTTVISLSELGILDGCRETSLNGTTPVPAAAYLDAALRAVADETDDVSFPHLVPSEPDNLWALHDVRLSGGLVYCDSHDVQLEVRLEETASALERRFSLTAASDGSVGQVTGELRGFAAASHPMAEGGGKQLDAALSRCDKFLTKTEFDRVAAARGFRFPAGSGVLQAWRREGTAVALVRPSSTSRFALLETAMRGLIAAWPSTGTDAGRWSYAVTAIEEVAIRQVPPGEFWSIVWFSPGGTARPAQADVLVLSQSGQMVASIQGISLTRLPVEDVKPDENRIEKLDVVAQPEPVKRIEGSDVRLTFTRHVATVLGTIPARVDLHKSLRDMGLDSIMATQLRRLLTESTGVQVSAAHLLEPGSAEHILTRLSSAGAAIGAA